MSLRVRSADPELRGLLRILAAQRRALRAGETETLAGLEPKLTALCDRLERQPEGAERGLLEAVRHEAGQALHETLAALAGLRDAQALLAAARAARPDATYGPQGERVSLAGPAGRLERRA